jgi:16S rRNA processing protein RimM
MDKIATGKIRTSHGVKGYVKVMSFSGDFSHFFDLEEVTLVKGSEEKTLQIETMREAGKDLLVKFQGIDTPEDARKYNGFDIYVERDQASSLNDGSYYLSDLIGCDVFFDGKKMGVVKAFFDNTPEATVEVKLESDGSMQLMLMRDEFVKDVDIASKRIELKVDWILE